MMETLEDRTLFSYPGFWQVMPSTTITKVAAPSFNAQGNDVAIEPIQISAERVTLTSSSDPNP